VLIELEICLYKYIEILPEIIIQLLMMLWLLFSEPCHHQCSLKIQFCSFHL
jgi:hypothetical protein